MKKCPVKFQWKNALFFAIKTAFFNMETMESIYAP